MTNNVQSSPGSNVMAPVNGVIANDVKSPPEQSFTTLVSGIIADAQQLIQQQFAMFRQEIRDDVRKSKEAAILLGAGVSIGLASSVLLLLMLSHLLHWAVPELPLWACFGIVGGVLGTLGGALVYAGVKKLGSFNTLSGPSAQTMKENLQWTTNPK